MEQADEQEDRDPDNTSGIRREREKSTYDPRELYEDDKDVVDHAMSEGEE